MKVEIYSDVACPWCYVGERRFARALGAFPQAEGVEVTFRPYQLDPSLPDTPHPLRESLTRKFGAGLESMLQQTAATAAADGLDLQFDRAQSVNTREAHRLMRLALQEGGPAVQRALAEGLFRAYFTDGLNVADPEVLVDLAATAGLDRERAAAYLATHEGVEDTVEEIAHAQRLGIRAVPTFVFDGRYAVQGAQPASTFLQVLEEVQREAAGAVTGGEDAARACDDGACAV